MGKSYQVCSVGTWDVCQANWAGLANPGLQGLEMPAAQALVSELKL